MAKLVRVGVLGAALVYFFDRTNGERRRAMLVRRIRGLLGRRAPEPRAVPQPLPAAPAPEVAHGAGDEAEQPDDVTLARKVESEIFRSDDVPKGQINVNAENGVVFLRGEVPQPDMVRELEEQARRVQGVRDVQNLLHLPQSDAPMNQ